MKTGALKDLLMFDEFSSILDKIASAFAVEEKKTSNSAKGDKDRTDGGKVMPPQSRKESPKPEVKVKRKEQETDASTKAPVREKTEHKAEAKEAKTEKPQEAPSDNAAEQSEAADESELTEQSETAKSEPQEAPVQEQAAEACAEAAPPAQPGLSVEQPKNKEAAAEDVEEDAAAESATPEEIPVEAPVETGAAEMPSVETKPVAAKQAVKETAKQERSVESAEQLPVESQDVPLPVETLPGQNPTPEVQAPKVDFQTVEQSAEKAERAAAAQAQTGTAPVKENVEVPLPEDIDLKKIPNKIEKAADTDGSAAFSKNESSNADVLAKLFENPVLQAEKFQESISKVIEYQIALSHQALKPVLELAKSKGSDASGSPPPALAQQLQSLSGAGSAAAAKNTGAPAQTDKAAARALLTKAAATTTMERVESVLKEAAKSKDGTSISLRLDPPSLGSVKVDVTLKDGALYARVVADNSQVNTLLREKAHELQAVLRKAGLDFDKVSVSVGSEQQTAQDESRFTGKSSTDRGKGAQSELGFGIAGGVEQSAHVVQSERALDHWIA